VTRSLPVFPALLVVVASLACNSGTRKPAEEPEEGPAPAPAAPPPIVTTEYAPAPAPTATASQVATAESRDAPEISRSAGVRGGAVVLFPRIVLPRDAGKPDAETLALAQKLQAHLANVVKKAVGSAPVDVRPEPERVCPKTGCEARAFGLLLAKAGGGCSVFALVSAPGVSPQRIVPWSPGSVKLAQSSVGFREPPERVVHVTDYASCAKLPEDLAAKEPDVLAAISQVEK